MTNGEKMQAVFPNIKKCGESKDTLDYSLGGMVHRVIKSWWNAEYKEPNRWIPVSRKFEEIVAEYPPAELCAYPEYRGKPYYSIKYEENGERFVGFGTYSPEVLSRYLREYFMVGAQEPRKAGRKE